MESREKIQIQKLSENSSFPEQSGAIGGAYCNAVAA